MISGMPYSIKWPFSPFFISGVFVAAFLLLLLLLLFFFNNPNFSAVSGLPKVFNHHLKTGKRNAV